MSIIWDNEKAKAMFSIMKVALFFIVMCTLAGCTQYGGKPKGPPPSTDKTVTGIPQFPWPPPKVSAFEEIPERFLRKPNIQTSLKDVSNRLVMAFQQAGYGEKSWYQCPNGFALVSQMEQIYSDGSPMGRWIPNVDNRIVWELKSYFKTLFTAPKGFYRVIVIVVTDQDFSPSHQTVSPKDAREWLTTGGMRLPQKIGVQPYTRNHYCMALIYEFENRDHNPIQVRSDISGYEHLKKAGIWVALGG